MRRLSDRNDNEDPRDPLAPGNPGSPFRQVRPDQVRPDQWRDEPDRALRDSFSRFGAQQVPEPPPRERRPLRVLPLLGLAVVVAAGSAYAGMTFMARWVGVASSDTHVELATADAPPPAAFQPPVPTRPTAAPPPVATMPSSLIPSMAAAAAPVSPPVAQVPPPAVDFSQATAAIRTANAAPTAARNIQSMAQGVTDTEIRFGIAAPFSGPAKEMGRQLKLGIETAFAVANDNGGVDGRQLKLVTADDGYEPSRTLNAMKQLYEKDQVFGFVDNYGS